MMKATQTGKALLVLTMALGLAGAALACDHEAAQGAAMQANAVPVGGSHCMMNKGISKQAKMTSDGAVITLTGKNAEAISHIKEHVAAHQKGDVECKDCPLGSKDVSTSIEMNEKGAVITAHAKTPEAVKAVQEWAKTKDGCCNKDSKKA